jgi:hypothetical protein
LAGELAALAIDGPEEDTPAYVPGGDVAALPAQLMLAVRPGI